MIAEDEDPNGFDWLPDGLLRVSFVGGPKDGEVGEIDKYLMTEEIQDYLDKTHAAVPIQAEEDDIIVKHALYERFLLTEKKIEFRFTGVYVNNLGELMGVK